jgi:hypothetical protein
MSGHSIMPVNLDGLASEVEGRGVEGCASETSSAALLTLEAPLAADATAGVDISVAEELARSLMGKLKQDCLGLI